MAISANQMKAKEISANQRASSGHHIETQSKAYASYDKFYLVCDEDHPCQGLGRHASFANFGIAWLTLFRVSTGDNWNGIMKVSFLNV